MHYDAMDQMSLNTIEDLAASRGLTLRLKTHRLPGLVTFRVGVARGQNLIGELKGWTIPFQSCLHLDTLRVASGNYRVGLLIWAAIFAWAVEVQGCSRAQLLAINDSDEQHRRLVRYFQRLGFRAQRPVNQRILDIPDLLVWGGAGLLMEGDCFALHRRCQTLLGLESDREEG
jgi:hypothetical protein